MTFINGHNLTFNSLQHKHVLLCLMTWAPDLVSWEPQFSTPPKKIMNK